MMKQATIPMLAEASALFAITVEITVAVENLDAFLALARANAARSIQNEPGCLRFDVLTPATGEGPTTVLFYEIDRDKAAFEAHILTPHFQDFDQATRLLTLRKTVAEYLVLETARS